MRYKIPKKCEILFLLKGGFSIKKNMFARFVVTNTTRKIIKTSILKNLQKIGFVRFAEQKKISSPKRKTNSEKNC